MNSKLDKLLEDLRSDDPTVLIPAMDESVEPLREFAAHVVEAIKDPDYGLFAAERLYKLIATVIEEVENFLKTSTDFEARVQAAVVLLLLGSKSGVPCLLDAVEESKKSGMLAAFKLAQAGVPEAADRIIKRLRRPDTSQPQVILSFLMALKKLDVELPPDLESRFLGDDAPDEIREFVQAEWPHPVAPVSR